MSDICSEIIRFSMLDAYFEQKLSDESSEEYLIFNLAVMYQDKSFVNERIKIEQQIRKLITNTVVNEHEKQQHHRKPS